MGDLPREQRAAELNFGKELCIENCRSRVKRSSWDRRVDEIGDTYAMCADQRDDLGSGEVPCVCKSFEDRVDGVCGIDNWLNVPSQMAMT